MGAQMVGVTAAKEHVNRSVEGAVREVNREYLDFCEAVCGRAARLAPVDQGDLRGSFVVLVNGELWMYTESDASGGVTIVRDQTVPGAINEITIYVGTAGCVYALRQHEELTWQHPKGGQSKYMEQAWNELWPTLQQRLQDAARRGAQKGAQGRP